MDAGGPTKSVSEKETSEIDIIGPDAVEVTTVGNDDSTKGAMATNLNVTSSKSWFNIIKADDTDGYEETIAKKSSAERLELLNSKFNYKEVTRRSVRKMRKDNASLEFESPLCVAAAACSRKCFVRMLSDGADILTTDIEGCNVIHALIRAASENPKAEEIYTDMLKTIFDMYDIPTLKKLIFHEDSFGYRTIEAAAHHGTFGLFRMILETRDIYYKVIDEVGMCTFVEYDIGEYESTHCRERELRSPLRSIRMLQVKHAESFTEQGILDLPIIQQWINRKFLYSLPWIAVWFSLRVLYLTTNIIFDPRLVSNRTFTCGEKSRHFSCAGSGGGSSVHAIRLLSDGCIYASWAILAFDSAEFLAWMLERDRRRTRGDFLYWLKNSYVSYTLFYRVTQWLIAFVSIVKFTLAKNMESDAINVTKAICLPLVLMSFLYMLEIIPFIGLFAITFQKMCSVMIKFGFVTLSLWLIYAYFFIISLDDETNFGEIGTSVYTLFLIDSGGFNFTDPGIYVMIAHVSYFYISAVLLLNYLVAAMSTLSDGISKQRHLCLTLRRLEMACVVDDRVGRWLRKFYYMRHKKERPIKIVVKNTYQKKD